MSPFIAEIIGTAILILLGNGVVANVLLNKTNGKDGGWIVITWGWGIAVFVAVFTMGQFSGAHINPAVTVGLAMAGLFEWSLVPAYIVAQIIGGVLGAFLVWLSYKDHFHETRDESLILACHSTIPNIRNYPANFMTETIGTLLLVFGVLYLASPGFIGANGELLETIVIDGNEVGFGLGALSALPVGLLVLGIGLSLGGPTGYAINPARDLGPRIAHALLPISNKGSSDWAYSWVPVAAPIAGGFLAAGLYLLLSS
ncbi:MIP/aquaporin family protein [Fodinibius sediminis]|uniref:Glycerol uptake facilitator protein n=1 Tax=Fodinibius sediminis TaxID=1214077 RepID=A0A521C1L5_9BACT|nr:MIP/aquaporin family protein [Fodinibius sediminis]SMO52610.1 glycerol uptake facilitator protein [Fodinibius sediminis]